MFTGCPKITGEHKVHPYRHMEILCGGESQFALPGTFFNHPRVQLVQLVLILKIRKFIV